MTVCENGIYREMTAQEVRDFEDCLDAIEHMPTEPDEADRLKQRLEMLEECLLELSEIIYA